MLTRRAACLRLALLALASAGGLHNGHARADEIQIDSAILELTGDGPAITAEFRFDLPIRLEEALANGVPLHFLVECEIMRPRWYWLDERVATAVTRYRLSYNALTRNYRLSSGALHQDFPTLAEALRTMSRMQSWVVAEPGVLKPATTYEIWVRMRLDASQLPRPLQVTAFGNREWSLASTWRRWRFIVPEGPDR